MTQQGRTPRRRRRRRASRPQGAPAPAPEAPAAPPPDPPTEPPVAKQPRHRRTPRESGAERGLRDIVGAGRSQVGVSGALRARDVNRPTEEDLAEAEREIAIVHRNWRPPN
jgi:hypothetical protein